MTQDPILDIDTLIEACRKRLGAPHVDIDPLELEGLRIYARDALASARRDRTSTTPARDWVRGWILNHIMMQERLREDPTLLGEPVTAPIFIVAPARTGSTLLQHLLALDPTLHSPSLWELWHPFHPRDPAQAQSRPREAQYIRNTAELLTQWPPAALRLHPMAPETPDECHWILRHNTVRASLQLTFDYWDWLKALDKAALTQLYTGYRRQVQVMQALEARRTGRQPRRWLSKTFAHMHYWPVLFDVFPDAHVIRLHRDPNESLASTCNLIFQLARGGDPLLVGEMATAMLIDGLERMLAADVSTPNDQATDVRYSELIHHSGAIVERVATRLGLISPVHIARTAEAVLVSPGGLKPPSHHYSPEDFGLTTAGYQKQYRQYRHWVVARASTYQTNSLVNGDHH
jgi:hypothetical protein